MCFLDERSETCRNKVACPRPHSQRVAELRRKRRAAQLLGLFLLPEAMLPLHLTEVKSAASGLSPRAWWPFNLWGSPRGALFRAAAQGLPAWCPHLGPIPAGPASSRSSPVAHTSNGLPYCEHLCTSLPLHTSLASRPVWGLRTSRTLASREAWSLPAGAAEGSSKRE